MDLTLLYRRAAAEGLPVTTLAGMLAVIERVGARMRTHGHFGRRPYLDLTDAQMREMLTQMTQYCGGYMFSGEWADSPQVGSIEAPLRHWVNEYDGRDRNRPEYQVYLDEVLSKALVINHGSQSRANDLRTTTYHRDGDMWRCVSGYCAQTERSERDGLFLPDGIFRAVATELGVVPSTTFKRLFDAAVASCYE